MFWYLNFALILQMRGLLLHPSQIQSFFGMTWCVWQRRQWQTEKTFITWQGQTDARCHLGDMHESGHSDDLWTPTGLNGGGETWCCMLLVTEATNTHHLLKYKPYCCLLRAIIWFYEWLRPPWISLQTVHPPERLKSSKFDQSCLTDFSV